MSIITLTSDFGCGSRYAAAIKGVILSRCPQATIVDLSHGVPPQDIRRAALLLDDAAGWNWPIIIRDNAAERLGIALGAPVALAWDLGVSLAA